MSCLGSLDVVVVVVVVEYIDLAFGFSVTTTTCLRDACEDFCLMSFPLT